MKKLYASLACLLGLLLPGLATAQDNPITVDTTIFLVSVVDGAETLMEATEARPGQVVEYQITATNSGETPLPAGTVTITGPVPATTTFVADSATLSSDDLLTEFSLDGDSFSETPATPSAENYRSVRWTLLTDLQPGQVETFVYRVTVNQE